MWIGVSGSPNNIFPVNGQEFANSEFIELNDYLSINVKTTAAESPKELWHCEKKEVTL